MWGMFKHAIATQDALPFAGTFEVETFSRALVPGQTPYVACWRTGFVGMCKMGPNF